MLGEAIAGARQRGERAMVLEVFERNAPALALYRSLGFRPVRRLLGHRRQGGAGRSGPLAEMDPLSFARLVAAEGPPDLPWMLAAETLSAAAPPTRAYRLGDLAFALVSDPEQPRVALRALLVPRTERRRGHGTAMVEALTAAFPDRLWLVPAIVPEELAPGFLERLGFEQEELSQLDMRLSLAP